MHDQQEFEAHLRSIRRLKPIATWTVERSQWGEVLARSVGQEIAPVYRAKVEENLHWIAPGLGFWLWDLHELQGGGCFFAPKGIEKIRLHRFGRPLDDVVSGISAGLCATALATNELQGEAFERPVKRTELRLQARRLDRYIRRQPSAPALWRVMD